MQNDGTIQPVIVLLCKWSKVKIIIDLKHVGDFWHIKPPWEHVLWKLIILRIQERFLCAQEDRTGYTRTSTYKFTLFLSSDLLYKYAEYSI